VTDVFFIEILTQTSESKFRKKGGKEGQGTKTEKGRLSGGILISTVQCSSFSNGTVYA